MRWLWQESAHQRRRADLLYLRCESLESQIRDLKEQLIASRAEVQVQRTAVEKVVDNALFAAGAAPIFDPGAARFQPRSVEQQRAESHRDHPLSPAEWRARVEQLDAEAAERNRKAELAEDLRKLAAGANSHGDERQKA